MSLDTERVRRTARLAGLEIDEDEIARLAADLGRILEHVDRLAELDVKDVPPHRACAHATKVFRSDDPVPGIDRAAALGNAVDHDGRQIRVPRVIR